MTATTLLAVSLTQDLVRWLEVRAAEEGVSVSRLLEFLLQEKRQRENEVRRRARRRAPAAAPTAPDRQPLPSSSPR